MQTQPRCCCCYHCCSQAYRDNKARITSQYNLPSLRRLFEVVDVLGISHYAPMPQQMTYESFEVRTLTNDRAAGCYSCQHRL
jgi:hypothetical protein